MPMLNSMPRKTFCFKGRESDTIIGIGTAMIRTSLLRLKAACTIAKCSSVVHCGFGGGTAQYPVNGWHALKKAISTLNQPTTTHVAAALIHFMFVVPVSMRAYMNSIQAFKDQITFSMHCLMLAVCYCVFIRSRLC